MSRLPNNRASFARFYLEKVAISEGCGCAELAIRRDEPTLRNDSGTRALWQAVRDRWRAGRQERAHKA